MSDFSIYKQLETARISSNKDVANAAQVVDQSHQREGRFVIANASATLAETMAGINPYAGNVASVKLTLTKPAVANSTDYTLVTLSKRTGNGAAVVVGTANLANVTVTAFTPIAFALVSNAANTVVAASDTFTITTALTGNGTANNSQAVVDWLVSDIA